MRKSRCIIGTLAALFVAPFAFAAPQAKLEAGDAHTYTVHVESSRHIDLGMGMERKEAVTFDGRFELLVREVTEQGSRVQLIWREAKATPEGSVAGVPVDDVTLQAWTDAGATLIDQQLELFVLPKGRIAGIEGLSKLSPPKGSEDEFVRVFGEADMIALLQGVFTPTGAQHAAQGLGVLGCDIDANGQKDKEGDVLTGAATLDIPEDVRSFPGLTPGVGEAKGALTWDAQHDRLVQRKIEANARIYKEGPPLTANIEGKSVVVLERVK
ncbi:MAG: hypothetical protein KDA20_10365 [Phycisphaerales bacterium]|nr:hypothetical protein [Phycisphaerales bacterium]